jgi:phosphohistidine phosphatase SixA
MPSTSLRHVLDEMSTHLQAIRAREAGARSGADPEDLHEMRVAVRRLRGILRASRALFQPRPVDRLRAELGWLGGKLGHVRDLDVLHAYLHPRLVALAGAERGGAERVLRRLAADRSRARAALHQALAAPDLMLTSPLLRARATAEIAAAAFGKVTPHVEPALGRESVDAVVAALKRCPRDATVALVGHEPTLSRLLGRLLGVDPDDERFAFKKGGAALLDLPHGPGATGRLHWFIRPRILRSLGGA